MSSEIYKVNNDSPEPIALQESHLSVKYKKINQSVSTNKDRLPPIRDNRNDIGYSMKRNCHTRRIEKSTNTQP